jgi:flagellar hook-length control protein FliK
MVASKAAPPAAPVTRASGNEDGTDSDSAAASTATAPSVQSSTLLNLALAEGSDATGATASALQAADSPAPAPLAVVQGPVLQISAGAPDSAPSVPAIATAVLAASDTSLLTNDGNEHARGGAGDASSGNSDGAAALQQLSANVTPTSTDATTAPTLKVRAEVDSTDFPQGLSDRVSFMVDNNWNSAKLQVNPPQLGPIELQIAVQGDHAQILMSTHSAVTREALESSLPKLREMLNSQGFAHVSVDISQRSFQERSAYAQPYERMPHAPSTSAPVSAPSRAAPRISVGVVDAYA